MTAPPQSLEIDAQGQALQLLRLGSGPDVLLLHGFPDCAEGFLPVMLRLADAGFRATALHLRGYAPSALASDDDYRVDALASDLLGVLDSLSTRPAVVGHDWGAIAAYAAATRAPGGPLSDRAQARALARP